MKLQLVTVDIESFWSTEHSLSKMNPILYCVHPETEIISLSYKFGSDRAHCIIGEQAVKQWAKAVDWSDKLVVGHNLSLFDAMILKWRLGIKPAMWGCTLAMARPIHGLTVGGSLSKLCTHYADELRAMGINPVKDQTALIQTKGRHLKDFTDGEVYAMKEYNANDVDQCYGLFNILLPLTPKKELKIIDGTIRMLVEPKFRLDVPLLTSALAEERARKRDTLITLATKLRSDGYDDDEMAEDIGRVLNSAPKFAQLLKDLGVDPPMKPSPTNPEKLTYALAKTDEQFTDLTNHSDPLVAAAASARLGVKSTILESRLQAFLNVAQATGGRMPIAKNYYGAHTGRFSGCLVADTLVTCYDAYTLAVVDKRIVDVLPDDLVWDGEGFVAHDGVAFSGYAEVIEWDGVTGTEDHVVFTNGEEVSLSEARSRGLPIKTCRSPTRDDVDAARTYLRDNKRASAM